MTDHYQDQSFSAAEYARRLSAVRAHIADQGWAAILVVDPGNIYYLTGFNRTGYFSFTCVIVALDQPPILIARRMEEPTAALQAPDTSFVGYDDTDCPSTAIAQALHRAGIRSGTVGAETDSMHLPPRLYQSLFTRTSLAWMDGSGAIESISQIKSPAELEYIKQAARLSDLAVDRAITSAAAGVSEAEIAGITYQTLVASGGDHPAFPPLVRTTRRIAYEHLAWSADTLRPGDGLVVELSGCRARYHAPLTRTNYCDGLSLGNHDAARLALDGLEAVRTALRPGGTSGDAYTAWQSVMDDTLGKGCYRRHNCGHLVGYGFFPGWFGGARMTGLAPGGTAEIREGMTIHVFSWVSGPHCPGDYVLSDTVLVTEEGAKFLTHADRQPTPSRGQRP